MRSIPAKPPRSPRSFCSVLRTVEEAGRPFLACVSIVLSCSITLADDKPIADIATILHERCEACHGSTRQEGNYRLDTFAWLRKAGDSGAPPIRSEKPADSELIRRVTHPEADVRMPPEGPALSHQQITSLKSWIDAGARVPDELAEKPIGQLAISAMQSSLKVDRLEHYPAAIPVATLAVLHSSNSEDSDNLPDIITGGYGEVLQWKAVANASYELSYRQRVPGYHISQVSLSHDQRWLAVGSGAPGRQGIVEVYELDCIPWKLKWSKILPDLPGDLAFAHDSPRLAIGQVDGGLSLVDLAKASTDSSPLSRQLTPHADAILCVAWSADSTRLITGSRDRTAKIFRMPELELIANYDRHERAVGGVAYLGQYPVTLDETGRLRLWSGDENDRTLTETDTKVRFLEGVVSAGEHLHLARGGTLLTYQVEHKKVDDGQDEQGKPKQKSVTRWRSSSSYESRGSAWLMSCRAAGPWIVGGTETGEVLVWERESEAAPVRFTAKP